MKTKPQKNPLENKGHAQTHTYAHTNTQMITGKK